MSLPSVSSKQELIAAIQSAQEKIESQIDRVSQAATGKSYPAENPLFTLAAGDREAHIEALNTKTGETEAQVVLLQQEVTRIDGVIGQMRALIEQRKETLATLQQQNKDL
jgi:hypothetical protein